MSPTDKAPSIEQIMRCHRLMLRQICNQETMPEADIDELDRLEQLCGPFDTHEILYDKITALQEELEGRKEAYSKLDDVNIKLNEQIAKLKEAYGVLREGLKFYSTKEEEKVVGQIEWNPHVCDSYSGLIYAPDWDGDLQDEPGEIAQKAIARAEEVLK